jgi:uncharacterized protein (TIGR00290 family)
VEVVGLLTTVDGSCGRVGAHCVPLTWIEEQARAVGLPLISVPLPRPCPNDTYRTQVGAALQRDREVTHVVFGDLFLEDIRAWREQWLAGLGLSPLFPLWGMETRALASSMMHAGVRARIVCVDPKRLDEALVGREWDEELLRALPPEIDPCGERGEFHTFVYAGPFFPKPLPVERLSTPATAVVSMSPISSRSET